MWRTLELEVANPGVGIVGASWSVRLWCLFRPADQLVHGVETGVSRQSLVSDCLASIGQVGFRSARLDTCQVRR